MPKIYLLGKLLDPELKKTSKGKSYLEFAVYANHESMKFSVFEIDDRNVTDLSQVTVNPLFKIVSDIKDGSPVMVSVSPAYDDKLHAIRYYLRDIYELSPTHQDCIRSVLNRDVEPAAGFSFKKK